LAASPGQTIQPQFFDVGHTVIVAVQGAPQLAAPADPDCAVTMDRDAGNGQQIETDKRLQGCGGGNDRRRGGFCLAGRGGRFALAIAGKQ